MYQRLLIPATDQLPCFRTVVTYASDSQLDAFLVDDLDDIVFLISTGSGSYRARQ